MLVSRVGRTCVRGTPGLEVGAVRTNAAETLEGGPERQTMSADLFAVDTALLVVLGTIEFSLAASGSPLPPSPLVVASYWKRRQCTGTEILFLDLFSALFSVVGDLVVRVFQVGLGGAICLVVERHAVTPVAGRDLSGGGVLVLLGTLSLELLVLAVQLLVVEARLFAVGVRGGDICGFV